MSSAETSTHRPRNADATRAALLEAATKRFTVLGYERTTTRDIAADAGANVSLIARYFGSKDGLFAEVLQESSAALDKLRDRDDGDLATSIVEGLQPGRWPEFGGEHPLLLLVRGAGDGDDKTGELRRRSLDTITEYLGEQVTAVGGGRPGDDALRGDVFVAMLVGLLTVRSVRPEGPLATADPQRLQRLTDQLLATIAAVD